MKTLHSPEYLAALKREISEMTDEQTKDYAREAMDSDDACRAFGEDGGLEMNDVAA